MVMTPDWITSNAPAQRNEYGSRLADLVVPLAYAKGHMKPAHQSEHHVFRYKSSLWPSLENLQDLRLMIYTASRHGACIARGAGWWEILTFVPSTNGPVLSIPSWSWHSRSRYPGRASTRSFWTTAPTSQPTYARLWPRGSRSPASDAGATAVTILCVARWLSQNYGEDHRLMIKNVTAPYDATTCPVTGEACP
jgi:hypothetical protein